MSTSTFGEIQSKLMNFFVLHVANFLRNLRCQKEFRNIKPFIVIVLEQLHDVSCIWLPIIYLDFSRCENDISKGLTPCLISYEIPASQHPYLESQL